MTSTHVALLLLLVAVALAGLFGLNLYFRVKVLRSYSNLSRNRVDFAMSDIFSPTRMHEIITKYPDHESDIMSFARHMRYSVWLTSVFIVIIIIFGSILMYYR